MLAAKYRFPPRYRISVTATAALVVACLVSSPQTLNGTSTRIMSALGAIMLIAACGQLLVIMIGGIDLSVPAIITLSAAASVKLYGAGHSLPSVLAIALALALAAGLANGLLVARVRLNPVIVTLAMQGVVTAVTLLWAGVSFSASGEAPEELITFTARTWGPVSVLALVALAVVAVVAGYLRRTRPGRRYVAIGANPVAARILGMRTVTGTLAGYGTAGLLYGFAGILLAGFLKTPNLSVGQPYQLSTVVAVALSGAVLAGGPATIVGLVASVFFLTLLDQYLAVQGVSGGMQLLVQGVVLIAAVAMLSLTENLRAGRAALRRLSRRRRAGDVVAAQR
jgi:ribose transport system permease protein